MKPNHINGQVKNHRGDPITSVHGTITGTGARGIGTKITGATAGWDTHVE